jgi:23S rRNA (pseudouridine1915-N3)-methyltransferase
MRLAILAGGRARLAPETRLAEDYLDRIAKAGRRFGLSGAVLHEIDERKAGEPAVWQAALPQGAIAIALDERGEDLASTDFAARLGHWLQSGAPALAFLIGAADGLPPALRNAAAARLAFGRATWPHLLVRVMLAEQIYRALTIAAGHPYHRP